MNVELLDEPAQTTALTAPQRAAVALSSAQTRADLAELVKKSANIVAVLNADARMECHAAAMALVKARTSIEKVGKAAREDAQAFSRAVIAEEKSLISITAAEEARLLALRNAWDEARAAEKAEAERVERERITKIHLRIADIRAVVGLAQQSKLAECYDLLGRLEAFKVEGFEEFSDEATAVLAETTATVTSIHAAKVAEEAERQRIRAEQEAERLKLAAEREKLSRLRAEQAAAQAKVEADAKALRDAETAELARQREALMAEIAAANKLQQEARAALEAELSMMRAALAEPAEPEAPEPVAHTEPVLETVAYVDVVAGPMSHTTGQWTAIRGQDYDHDTEWGVKCRDYWLASCYYSGADDVRNGTAEANARVMAAAPDLLEALEGLLAGEDTESTLESYAAASERARAAIAKAKGATA